MSHADVGLEETIARTLADERLRGGDRFMQVRLVLFMAILAVNLASAAVASAANDSKPPSMSCNMASTSRCASAAARNRSMGAASAAWVPDSRDLCCGDADCGTWKPPGSVW